MDFRKPLETDQQNTNSMKRIESKEVIAKAKDTKVIPAVRNETELKMF